MLQISFEEMGPDRVSDLDFVNSSLVSRFKAPMEYHHFVDSTKGSQWGKMTNNLS
jgi:hypothetical protein